MPSKKSSGVTGDLEIGQLQGAVESLNSSVAEIKTYLSNGIARHTEVMTKLAVIQSNQADVKKDLLAYQDTCGKDRIEMNKKITKVSDFQRDQKKIAASIVFVFGLLPYGVGKILEKLGGLFSS